MKDRKSLLLMLPILVFLGTFLILRLLDNRSYAIITSDDTTEQPAIPDGTVYNMIKKNTYSWHLITHNFNSFSSTNASGTKLLETKSNMKDGHKYKSVAYCATEGKTLSQSSKRTRYAIDSSNVTKLNKTKKNTLKAVMPYMYPYINLGKTSSDENTLKSVLKSSDLGLNGNDYDTYQFDKLNVNEAITGVQAAIWNIEKGKTDYYKYRGTISSFSAFNSCSDYYNGKMLTSEELSWWNATECNNKTGNFYKYVVNHTKDSNTEKRINVLADWYTNILQGKLEASGARQPEYFNTLSATYTNQGVLNVSFDTNLSNYTIVFKDQDGNQIGEPMSKTPNDSYELTGLAASIKRVNIEVTSTGLPSSNVYYYVASSGQDFIGLEKTYYTINESLSITRDDDETGKIIVYKVGNKEFNVDVKDNGSQTFDGVHCGGTADNCLSNAKFELYYQNKNNLIRVFETNYQDTTSVEFNNLPLGTYYLRETQPPEGYDIYNYNLGPVDSEGYIVIELTGDGLGTSTQTKAVVVNNTHTRKCFRKVSSDSPNEILGGAVFEIQDIDGNVIEEFTTSSQEGEKCFDGELQSGSYFIKEVSAPNGFSIDPVKYHFTVGKADSDISSLQDIGNYKETTNTVTLTLTNKKGLTMSKTDVTDGACVTGALLVIKDSQGTEVTRWTSTCSSNDEEGEDSHTVPICLTNEEKQAFGDTACLMPGKYTLTENIHPEGYATAETIGFEIGSDGKITGDANMKDAPIEVCIYKVKKDTDEVLTGAEFDIYTKRTNKPWEVESNTNGTCLSSITPVVQDDNYIYEASNSCIKEYDIVYDDNSREKIGDALASGRITLNELAIRGVSIEKRERRDSDINDPALENVPYFVSNDKAEWNLFSQFVSAKEPCIPYFPVGDYLIRETKAPDGYELPDNKDTIITVEDKAGHQDFYIPNEVKTPKTAMDYSVTVIIIASVFMMFGIGLVGYYEYKKGH